MNFRGIRKIDGNTILGLGTGTEDPMCAVRDGWTRDGQVWSVPPEEVPTGDGPYVGGASGGLCSSTHVEGG